MKAEKYLAQFMRKELGKTAIQSKRLAERITKNLTVRAIKEGPESAIIGRKSYVN